MKTTHRQISRWERWMPGVQGGGETTAAQWVLREKELADDQC